MKFRKLLIGVSLICITTSPTWSNDNHHHDHHAHEDESTYNLHIDTRTYFTSITNADEHDEEIVDIFTHSHIEGGYNFNDKISVLGSVILEGDPAGHSHGGGATRQGDRFFDDHPLYIETLTLNYNDKDWGGYIGKFSPHFGIDPHTAPGWWGMLTFEDFQIKEKLGFGGYIEKDIPHLGHQRFDVATYFADTSFLSQSTLFNRTDIGGHSGGASNTEDFSSITTQLSGDIMNRPHMNYYMGYADQGTDNIDEKDETRYVFGLSTTHAVTDKLSLVTMADLTQINYLNGEAAHDRRYASLGLNINFNNWNAGGSYTHINNDADDATESMNGFNTQLSLGYNFNNGFGVDLGYQAQDSEGEKSDRIGALVRYHADF